jgi:PKHD-type hydroxylase
LDGAIRQVPGTPHRVRTDLSATVFLTPPEDYDGGELTVEDTYGEHAVKLGAGDMVLYPGTSLHHVKPVTRGVRVAAFFWTQSLIRDDSRRALLFDMDLSIQDLARALPESRAVVSLTNAYHNLLRMWADS